MADIKTAPGLVRMKCMIWEPTPVKTRSQQDEAYVYNATTLEQFGNLTEQVAVYPKNPSGVYLRPKFVYRDTFLAYSKNTTGNGTTPGAVDTWLKPEASKCKNFNNLDLFDNNGVPKYPWIYHQTFKIEGSLFDTASTGSLGQSADGNYNLETSQWTYHWEEVGNETPGKPGTINGVDDFDSSTSAQDPITLAAVAWRKSHRFMPMQIKVSSTSNSTVDTVTVPGSVTPPPAKGIHWLALKTEPLFHGEDFFVQFTKTTYAPDPVYSSRPYRADYKFLDPKTTDLVQVSDTAVGTLPPLNLGVIDLTPDAKVNPDSLEALDLSKQPYMMVEINAGNKNHNYFVIFAYNHNPVFIHAGHFPVLAPTKSGGTPEENQGPTIVLPTTNNGSPNENKISRRLSTYNISCRKLMEGDLRMTVRNHLGKLVITFAGFEDNPWIIERYDYDIDAFYAGENPIKDIKQRFIYMTVTNNPIKVSAGNMACAFTFGPLHYVASAGIPIPDAIGVLGPELEQKNLNLLLREKTNRTIQGATVDDVCYMDAAQKLAKQIPTYSQSAEVYFELINGVICPISRQKTLDPQSTAGELYWMAGYNSASTSTTSGMFENKNLSYDGTSLTPDKRPIGSDGYFSYIRIAQGTPLKGVPIPVPPSEGDPNPEPLDSSDRVKYFNAIYEMGAGDMVVAKGDPKKKWVIANCITPIATGWRLFVPDSLKYTNTKCGIDVAHHVATSTISSSYSDNVKIEKNGSIKFWINLGTMTSLANNAGNNQIISNSGDCAPPENPYSIDRGPFLASLANKTFFIRIYAWWQGGFMDCNINGCPCKMFGSNVDTTPGNGSTENAAGDQRVIFTGLARGGPITMDSSNKRFMTVTMIDYWQILKDSVIFNSPFFDGMRDFNAVYELLKLTGLSDKASPQDKYPPLSFVKQLKDTQSSAGPKTVISFSEKYIVKEYGLPSSYDILQSPVYKFEDNSNVEDAIMKIANNGSKVAGFDRYGVFRYITQPHQLACIPNGFKAKCHFYASTYNMAGKPCRNLDTLSIGPYTYERINSDTVNNIALISTTPEGAKVVLSDINMEGRNNPDAEGYLGYKKSLIQTEGLPGSERAAYNLLQSYKGVYRPPIKVSWESFGISKLSAGDVVTFTGLQLDDAFPPQTFADSSLPPQTITVVLTSVSSEIDAERNDWKNRYEGEWYFNTNSYCDANANQ